MHIKVLILLSLLVVLPVALISALGIRLAVDEQQMIEHRFQRLIDARLRAVDATVQAYFAVRERELRAAAASLSLGSDPLRAYSRREPRIRQILLMAADGARLHPPPDAPLTGAEQRLLERTEAIWADKDMLYRAGAKGANPRPPAPRQTDGAGRDHGWYVWPWGTETNLIFWYRDTADRVLGFELEPVRLLADIINLLPATGAAAHGLEDARIRLIDGRGSIAYQWGAFEPAVQLPARAVLPLNHPLDSWRLAYYTDGLQAGRSRLWLTILAALSAVGVAIAGLAVYLYREHTRAVRLARQRVNFVNQVSHELKTPLTNIRMYAELLAEQLSDEWGEDEKPRRYLEIIVTESQRLSRLISSVLSFARQPKDRSRLRKRPGRVDEIIAATLAAFRPALANKDVVVRFHGQAGTEVCVDADVLEQILNNLFSNVEKYAAAGGVLAIESHHRGAQILIEVADHGPGIPKQEREKIFKPFYRIGSKLNEGVTGAGIGLAIARRLARQHGGDLVLTPSARGACFRLSLNTADKGEPL